MYYKHFNLSGPPFQFTPSASVLYPSRSHQEALAALEWGILHELSGLTLLLGEPGTGKTTLISSVLAHHFEHVRVAYIPNPKLSFDEILQVIARQLEIVFKSEQRLARLDAIDEFLEAHRFERIVVIVDEVQVMPDSVVEELRLLSNCSPGRQTALRFVFVGQPEFLHRLEAPGLRQVNERIGARAMLNPLQPGEILEYIDYRLRAKKGSAKEIFAASALRIIADACSGIPRRINVLCHNAMLLAYTSGSTRVRAQHAKAAAAEYNDLFANTSGPAHPLPVMARTAPHRNWRTAVAVAALAAAIGAVYLWSVTALRPRDSGVSSQAAASRIKPVSAVGPMPLTESSALAADSAKSFPLGSPRESPIEVKLAAAARSVVRHRLRPIRVRDGDTVQDLARRYMGAREDLAAVIAVNPQLADINRIYPGEVVYLPEIDSPPPMEQ